MDDVVRVSGTFISGNDFFFFFKLTVYVVFLSIFEKLCINVVFVCFLAMAKLQ